jgi:hypothetical protein
MAISRRTALGGVAGALGLAGAASAAAEHARITLKIEGPGGAETAFVDQTPPASGKNPRPVARVRAGQLVRYEYLLTNVYPHKTLEGVVVHFFVAPIEAPGQAELPDPTGEGTLLETAFDLDLGPGRNVGGRGRFTAERPGTYLVRVESRQTGSDHEHFSAIDLVVEA